MDFDDDDDGLFETVDLVEEEDEPLPKPGPSSGGTEAKTCSVQASTISNENEENCASKSNKKGPTFKDKTIENLLKKSNAALSKISEPAVKCTGELLKIYTNEILSRCAEQAMKEGATTVNTDHLEKVLAQFLLDLN